MLEKFKETVKDDMRNVVQVILSRGRQTLTSSADVVGLWKENFDELLNLTYRKHN